MPVRERRALAGMKALVTYPCVLGVELVVGEAALLKIAEPELGS
jgi:carbonic anhydrase/acetyltransferase-like protein (isoleucine patch superfamily)